MYAYLQLVVSYYLLGATLMAGLLVTLSTIAETKSDRFRVTSDAKSKSSITSYKPLKAREIGLLSTLWPLTLLLLVYFTIQHYYIPTSKL